MCVDVKRHRGENRTLGETIFDSSQPAMLAIAGVVGEAKVAQHLHDKARHVAVRYHLQELEMESVKPNGVLGSG